MPELGLSQQQRAKDESEKQNQEPLNARGELRLGLKYMKEQMKGQDSVPKTGKATLWIEEDPYKQQNGNQCL